MAKIRIGLLQSASDYSKQSDYNITYDLPALQVIQTNKPQIGKRIKQAINCTGMDNQTRTK